MKRFFFLICLIAGTLTSFASSETFQLPDSLKSKERVWVWELSNEVIPDFTPVYQYFFENGVLELSGIMCNRIEYNSILNVSGEIFSIPTVGAAYVQDGKYYFNHDINTPDGEFELELDFNIQEGEKLGHSYEVVSVDSIMVKGVPRKRILFNINACWVESIGTSDYGITYGDIGMPMPSNGDQWNFIGYFEKGECVFTYEDFFKTSTVNNIFNDSPSPESPLFDLMGREVNSPQSGSVYIRDGKKFIIR